MSYSARNTAVISISSSSSEDQEENDNEQGDDEEYEEEEEEEDDDDDEEEEEDDDDDDDEEEDDDGDEDYNVCDDEYEEVDCESIDDDSEAAPGDEARCSRVIKKLQGGQDLQILKLDECKAYLRKHGLRLSGTKEICIQRILEHWRIKDGNGEKLYPRSSFVINCTGDVCRGDVVLFTQRIYKKFDIARRGGGEKPLGKRTVAGRVVKESYGAAKQQHTFTVEILWSKGLKTLPPLFPLLVKGRNLYRLRTFRQCWTDEAERLKVLAEKHKRGATARRIRGNAKLQSSKGGTKHQRHHCTKSLPKNKKDRGTEHSTKAQKQVIDGCKVPLLGQAKMKRTVDVRDDVLSGSRRKRGSQPTRNTKKRQKNQEAVLDSKSQKHSVNHDKAPQSSARHFLHTYPWENINPTYDPIMSHVGFLHDNRQIQLPSHSRGIPPAHASSRGVHPFTYELSSTSTATGALRNQMAMPSLHHHTFNNSYLFDPRVSSHFPTQVDFNRHLGAVPPPMQMRVHESGLRCSMPGCQDLGSKSCEGSFCRKCCIKSRKKCRRHKLC